MSKELISDWDGKQPENKEFEKPKGIPDGTHTMTLIQIESKEFATYDTRLKAPEQQIKQEQFLFKFIYLKKDEPIELTYFVVPIIKKGGWKNKKDETASNSKMYDLLINLNLADKVKKLQEEKTIKTNEDLLEFLKQELENKEIKVATETQKENTDDEYVKITKIPKQ
jgi:hypothetical protein